MPAPEARDDRNLSVKKMMDACDKDPGLQAQLFKNPDEVAKKYGVTLSADEKGQLSKVAHLYALVDEFKASRFPGPGPIFYPADVWSKRRIFDHVLSYRPIFYPLFVDPIFYPIDILRIDVLRNLEALRLRQR